jgi:anion-transporting  ArsA/GET3 family ATPase
VYTDRVDRHPPLLERQLHFVCGKGGVGKSAVACALATHFRRQGHRVLLAQVNSPDSHAHLMETDEVPHDIAEIEPDLWMVNTSPDQALREYALMTLKFETLYKAAFENRLMRIFLRFVPSIAELTMLGKLWYHAEETDGPRRRFDRIVVDCPSTGHGVSFLRVSQVLTDVWRGAGPAAKKTMEMTATFEDPSRTALHVVTLAEEMPVNETIEFLAQIETSRVAPPGALFVNQLREPLVRPHEDALSDERDSAAAALLRARLRRESLEAHQIGRIEAALPALPRIDLPRLRVHPFQRDAVEALADAAFGETS